MTGFIALHILGACIMSAADRHNGECMASKNSWLNHVFMEEHETKSNGIFSKATTCCYQHSDDKIHTDGTARSYDMHHASS